jgi:hypothetical protein
LHSNLHSEMVRRVSNEGSVERYCLARIAHDCDGNEVNRAGAAARRIEIEPSRARQINLCPGMGRPASRTGHRLLRIVERDGEIPRREPRGESERTRRLNHQHGEIATTAVSKAERLHRLLDSLRFTPSIEETAVDALREPGERLEGADRTV